MRIYNPPAGGANVANTNYANVDTAQRGTHNA